MQSMNAVRMEPATDGPYTYTVKNGKATLVHCTGPGGAVTIPGTLGGYPVTTIGSDAFENCRSLTSVTLPSSVTSIGYAAFKSCTSLTSVTIPDSVTNIGDWAFGDCTSLISVTIPDSVTAIGRYSFQTCSSLASVTIGSGVTTIGDRAFENCRSLTSVTLPSSVTAIGNGAFRYCRSLTSVTLPSSVTSIGYAAFKSCTSLTSVTIPDSVTNIGGWAFGDCTSLASVRIGIGVNDIGDFAFSSCTSLASVHFAGNAPTAGDEALSDTPATVYYLTGTTGWGAYCAGRPTQPCSDHVPAPSDPLASVGKDTDRISFSWQPAAGATHYRVYRAGSATGAKTALGGWQTHSWYDDYSAPYVSTCYYFVRAARDANGTGASGYSAAGSGYRRLAAPTGIGASNGKYTDRVTVSWKPVAGANYYRVWRATSPTGQKTPLGGWRRETFYENCNPDPTRVYYYFVQAARDATGWRPSSISGYHSGWRAAVGR